jgi:hypothetical protein
MDADTTPTCCSVLLRRKIVPLYASTEAADRADRYCTGISHTCAVFRTLPCMEDMVKCRPLAFPPQLLIISCHGAWKAFQMGSFCDRKGLRAFCIGSVTRKDHHSGAAHKEVLKAVADRKRQSLHRPVRDVGTA